MNFQKRTNLKWLAKHAFDFPSQFSEQGANRSLIQVQLRRFRQRYEPCTLVFLWMQSLQGAAEALARFLKTEKDLEEAGN